MKANGAIRIDKGIPLPTGLRAKRSTYPWDGMEVGDSFLGGKSVSGSAARQARKRDWKFLTSREGGGRRVWRIS